MTISRLPKNAPLFEAEFAIQGLRAQYPRPGELLQLGDARARRSREAFVRLWLTEGIPFAFLQYPGIYEEIRDWLARRLNVCPKDVTLVGSGRLGYSLAPPPSYGRPFGVDSDLDISIVSEDLFARFRELFGRWEDDYHSGRVNPRHEKERFLWEENLRFGHRNISRGFLDANKVPTFDRYPLSQNVASAMWVLISRLAKTPGAPGPRRASVRVYDNWRNLVARVSFNLLSALASTI
jgi:hypothetical protein